LSKPTFLACVTAARSFGDGRRGGSDGSMLRMPNLILTRRMRLTASSIRDMAISLLSTASIVFSMNFCQCSG